MKTDMLAGLSQPLLDNTCRRFGAEIPVGYRRAKNPCENDRSR